MSKNYKKTLIACYLGFITQAICANFAPLLFLTFHNKYEIPLGQIALISTVFFLTQLIVDILCSYFADKIGYRKCVVASELCAAAGLIGLAFLPDLFSNPLSGIIASVIVYAIGSGLIEVLCSPIVEACPFDNKEAVMSLLHSFYCWGSVGVILLSTVFLQYLVLTAGNGLPASGLSFLCTTFTTSPPAPLSIRPKTAAAWAQDVCSGFRCSGYPLFSWSARALPSFPWHSGLPPTRNRRLAFQRRWAISPVRACLRSPWASAVSSSENTATGWI